MKNTLNRISEITAMRIGHRSTIGTAAFITVAAVALIVTACSNGALAQSEAADAGIKWGPAPAVFPPGAEMAVMQGDPGAQALFTVRLRFPDGYRIAPHTHPTDEHVTVLRGTLLVGMGKTFDTKAMRALGAGGFVTAPANHPHYVTARGQTVVQVHAMGPFALTYVNPSDAPKQASSR
jgi:quercetin dioxygenase-like cupin family protein